MLSMMADKFVNYLNFFLNFLFKLLAHFVGFQLIFVVLACSIKASDSDSTN